jgi:flagellar basal body rod protein FlgG
MRWLLLFFCLLPGLVQAQPASMQSRRRSLTLWCRENLAQQFTPGYKATVTNYFVGAYPDLDMSQGRVVATGIPLHLAIQGEGFFCLEGDRFTRDGRMQLHEGILQGPGGYPLLGYKLDEKANLSDQLGEIRFPVDPKNQLYLGVYNDYSFDALGNFLGGLTTTDPVTGHSHTDYKPLYRLVIGTFPQPHRLLRDQDSLLRPSQESGPLRLDLAGQNRLGFLVPNSVELSNVDPVQQAYIWGRLDAMEMRPFPQPAKKKKVK